MVMKLDKLWNNREKITDRNFRKIPGNSRRENSREFEREFPVALVSWSVRYGHLNLLFRQAHRLQLTDKIYTVNQFTETAKPDREKIVTLQWHSITLWTAFYF